MTELKVSVTDLVRFCHRSGDIDHRFTPSPTGPEGVAGHRRLYERRPGSYQSEYPVEAALVAEGLRLVLRGRADGYDAQAGLVEEIKTCRVAPADIPEAVARLHLAQGRLYAALIAREQDLEALTVRVTWLNIDSDEEHSLEQAYNSDELAAFLDATLSRFSGWIGRLAQLRDERNDSLATLPFPHGEFRAGQRDIAELSYKCIDQAGQLLLEAPTGIGKTAATLYPALKALQTGKHDRLVFVTARTTGRRAAEDALARCRDAGYRGQALSLTAKERICLSPGSACHGDDCPFARGYYDRLPDAMSAALERPSLARDDVEALAREYRVCPYELAGDLLPWIDTVIADQHYVYGLQGVIGTAIEQGEQRWSLLVDEAHNLPGRARDMYSARLTKGALMAAKREAPRSVSRPLERLNRRLLALRKLDWIEPGQHTLDAVPDNLVRALSDVTAAVAEQLGQDPTLLQRHPAVMDFFFDATGCLRVIQGWGPEYRLRLTADNGPTSLVLTLDCLDPARLLAHRQDAAHAVIAFSATLSPPGWSRERLGLGADTVYSRAKSPFAPGQLNVFIATGTDTRYRARERTLDDLAGHISHWLQSRPGNCIIYFPSYRYLNDCRALVDTAALQRSEWIQGADMDDAGRQSLIDTLEQRRDVAAFCILGGIFGEGIDLPGEQLASVVVVGVGMPQVNRDTRELQAWYEQKAGSGFEYTYLYPGMQKVDQALGRVVRGPADQGSALLIDPRYGRRDYRELLPPWWQYQAWEGQ